MEVSESLGFLPGDLKEKVDPYLRPLYDALHDVLGSDHTERLMERGVIEIAPLAYMRGRTLDDAYVILDEAQNTTPAQMKMFLTRLGFGSKMIITGDVSQIDLPKGVTSGLAVAKDMLKDINGISVIELDQTDVVRHPLVAKIIEAYDKQSNAKMTRSPVIGSFLYDVFLMFQGGGSCFEKEGKGQKRPGTVPQFQTCPLSPCAAVPAAFSDHVWFALYSCKT